MRCSLCTRPLDQPDQPLSRDSGSVCLDCAIASEDAGPVPAGFSPGQLLLWLGLHAEVEHRLVEAAPAYHYDPVKRTAPDRSPFKAVLFDAWHGRLAEHCVSADEARLLVHGMVDRVWTELKDEQRHVCP